MVSIFQLYFAGFITYKTQIAGMIIGFKKDSEDEQIINVDYDNIVDYCLFILQTTIDAKLKCDEQISNPFRIKYMQRFSSSNPREEKSTNKDNVGKMEKVIKLN